MDFSEYTKLLIRAALVDWVVIAFIFAIVIIDDLLYVHSGKKVKRDKEHENLSSLAIILLIIYSIYTFFSDTYPIIKDIVCHSYVYVSGEYSTVHYPASKTNNHCWINITTDDGEIIILHYPSMIDADDFPADDCYGTALYSESSKIILEFIPSDVDNGS